MIVMMGMILVFYAGVVGILYMTQRTDRPDFEEYAVGNRSYGPIYIAASYINSWWPGSTWTAYFGLAAGAGVFGLYGLAYSIVGVATMYFMATRAWRWGSVYDLRTQPDLIGLRFGSEWVKKVSSFIGVVSLFPWVILGMQALGTLFNYAGDGNWGIKTALFIGLASIVIRQYWTVKMGMRGLILTDVFQSIVAYGGTAIIAVVMMFGAGSPISFSDVSNIPAEFLNIPGDGDAYGPLYIFALIFTGVIGSLCWPTSFQRIYTASGVRAVKKGTVQTAVLSGLFYTLLMFIGLAVASTGIAADNAQLGWFTVMEQWGGTFFLGLAIVIVFAASMGHIDASVQVSGLQIANDLVQTKNNRLSDSQLTKISKASMAVFMVLAAVLAYATREMDRMQLLAQMSYQGIVQLAVPLFLGIFWRGGNKYGAITGMVGGFTVAAILTWIYPDDIPSLGSLTGGVVGLVVNLALFLVVSAITGRSQEEKARVDEFFDVAAGKAKPALTDDLVA